MNNTVYQTNERIYAKIKNRLNHLLKKHIMKRLYLLFIWGALLLNSSCENSSIINEPLTDNVNEKSTRASYYCTGKHCMPEVLVDRYGSTVTVQWRSAVGGNDHYITLTCSSPFFYQSESIYPSGGEWAFSVPYNEICDVTYFVRCSEYNCRECNKERTIRLLTDGTAISGSSTECFMDFLPYYIDGVRGQTLTLALNVPEEKLNQPDKYMEIDNARVYKFTQNGEKLQWAYVNKISPYKIEFTLPEEQDCYYRIEFFSSRCKHNDEHYMQLRYSSRVTGISLSSVNLDRVKGHAK